MNGCRFAVPLWGVLALAGPSACSARVLPPEVPGSPQAVDSSSASSLLARGRERMAAGDDSGALEALRAVLTADPPPSVEQRVEALRWCAHLHMRRSEPESALAAFQAARAESDGDAWLCYGEGTAWSLMGELERAEACFGAALERDSRHLKALQWRAETRGLLHDREGALQDLTRALKLLEESSAAELAAWGGDRRALLSMTLALRIETLDALGLHERAAEDRARRTRIHAAE